MISLEARLEILADAELPRTVIQHTSVSGAHMKQVLLVVFAHPGVAISVRALADRAQISERHMGRAVLGLESLGILTRQARSGDPRSSSYHIDWDRLSEFRNTEPLNGREARGYGKQSHLRRW